MRTRVHAILWVLVASLGSGCALVGAGRVSVGIAATTRGSVGLAVAGELGGGLMMSSNSDDVAVTTGMYLGGSTTSEGWELETGGHGEVVLIDGDDELRAGVRAGVVRREFRGVAVAPELAFELARASWWDWPRLGIELRAGPLIDLEDGARLEALRGYVGLAYRRVAISDTWDPIDSLLEDPNSGKH